MGLLERMNIGKVKELNITYEELEEGLFNKYKGKLVKQILKEIVLEKKENIELIDFERLDTNKGRLEDISLELQVVLQEDELLTVQVSMNLLVKVDTKGKIKERVNTEDNITNSVAFGTYIENSYEVEEMQLNNTVKSVIDILNKYKESLNGKQEINTNDIKGYEGYKWYEIDERKEIPKIEGVRKIANEGDLLRLKRLSYIFSKEETKVMCKKLNHPIYG